MHAIIDLADQSSRMKDYYDIHHLLTSFQYDNPLSFNSSARHIATSTYYKQQMRQYEENIANLQEEVEKTKEGKSAILAIFGKGDLAKARKELASKDE